MSGNAAGRREVLNEVDYWALARGRWKLIVLPAVLLMGVAFQFSRIQPDSYAATAKVLLADTASERTLDPSSQNPGFLSRELANELTLARSDPVEELVVEELGELPDMEIGSDPKADVLLFTASEGTADGAALAANTWAAMYVRVKSDESVENITEAIATLEDRLEGLSDERNELLAPLERLEARLADAEDPTEIERLRSQRDQLLIVLNYDLELVTSRAGAAAASLTDLQLQAELADVGTARIVEQADVPSQQSNTSLVRMLLPALLFGLCLGFALALLAELRDNTIRSAADVQQLSDLAVLASIPLVRKRTQSGIAVMTHTEPEGGIANSYHKVRSAIEFASLEAEIRSVLVTSANPDEGKSTTASNLALAASSAGRRVVLVDVDYHRPSVHRIYNVPENPGLSDFVVRDVDGADIGYRVQDESLENLMIVPSGTAPPRPAAFVGTGGFIKALEWLEVGADLVVLDAPPMLAVADPQTLGQHVDAVVLTAVVGRTTRSDLASVVSDLRLVGAHVLGVVLVGGDESDGYGKSYYRPDPDGVVRRRSGRLRMFKRSVGGRRKMPT